MAPSDEILLERFADTRDGECFAELVRRHGGMVYGVCRRVLRDSSLAEDAAQDTFLHLLRQPASVTDSLVGWLHRVAHHKAVNLVRREVSQSRRAQVPTIIADDHPPWATISPLFDEALQELPEESRRVLVSHYLEARSQQELATDLGLSQPTVSRRLAVGIAQLRALLIAKGVVASAVVASLLQGSMAAAAPATLAMELAKMTLAGQAGLGAGSGGGAAVHATSATASAAPVVPAAATMAFGASAVQFVTAVVLVAGAWIVIAHYAQSGVASSWRFVAPHLPAMAALPAPARPSDRLGDHGPARVLTLSTLSGQGHADVVGVAIAPDWSLVVAVNADPIRDPTAIATMLGAESANQSAAGAQRSVAGPSLPGDGCLLRYAPDGRSLLGWSHFPRGSVTLSRIRTDAHGDLLVGGTNHGGADLGGGPGRGGFVAKMSADAQRVMWIFYQEGISDFAAAGNGDLLVLQARRLTRYDSASGHQRWSVTWPSRGPDHPSALGYDAASDMVMVAGCSDAATGDEMFEDPYVKAFDASGHLSWTLWDTDPNLVRSGPGGQHLTADGSAKRLIESDSGVFLAQISTGGNTVLSHDAHDPSLDAAASVRAGVHQDSPGFGFTGATPVTALSRLDARLGVVAKQTWISAWRDPAHASAWAVTDICADTDLVVAVGDSAPGGPSRGGWFAPAADSQANGSIAIFDADLRLLQSGGFPRVHWNGAVMRGDVLVTVGVAAPEAVMPAFPADQSGGRPGSDGVMAVFVLERTLTKGTLP
jgi:RNA polymerase sigma factor (sigma-70 family)